MKSFGRLVGLFVFLGVLLVPLHPSICFILLVSKKAGAVMLREFYVVNLIRSIYKVLMEVL